MKKAFAILLAICMMIPVFAVSSFAADNIEATEINNTIPTVYAGTTVTDATANKGTRSNPYDNFVDAYGAVIANNTTGKAKIVLLGEVSAYPENNNYAVESSAVQLLLADFDIGNSNKAGTVYVCGECDPDTKKYTGVLNFPDGTNGTCVTLGANMVFYDMTFKNVAAGKNMWFAAAMHDLTFGFNISKIGGQCPFTGYVFNKTGLSNCDDGEDGAKLSFYSGSFGTGYLTFRSYSSSYSIDENITCDIYGGSFSAMSVTGESNSYSTRATGKVSINVYNDSVSLASINNPVLKDNKNVDAEVKFYNGCKSSVIAANKLLGTFADGTGVSSEEDTAKLTAPSYAVNYCGVQDKDDGETFSVRLVGTIDRLDEYDYIGFEIDINGVDYSNTSKRVYTSIQGADTEYSAAQLGSNYIYTRTITGLPETGTIIFEVRPFIWIGDSETGVGYYGQDYTVTYVNGELQK